MKKFILISLMAFVAFAVNAQRIDKSYVCSTCSVTSDTVSAETVYYTYAAPVKTFDGILGFQFTKTDLTDSCSVLKMQGSMFSSFTSVVDLTGTAALANTTTDGTTFLYVTDPIYLYYRLKVTAAAGDAVKFTNVKLIYK
jgi:hypothetical protein